MTTNPTPTPTPAPAPRPPAAVADMARLFATDYAAKADNILDGDGAYGARLVDELVCVLAGLAEELDRYQEAAVDPAVALLTPCQPPDAADAICHPGESWPCSRTHAAWALRSWDADAQVEAAVRRWRFREGAGDAGQETPECPKCGRLHHPWCQPYGGPGYLRAALAAADQPGEDAP